MRLRDNSSKDEDFSILSEAKNDLKKADFELKRRRSRKQPLLRDLLAKIISELEDFLSQSVAHASLICQELLPSGEGQSG